MILRLGSLQRELSIQDDSGTTSRLRADRSGCQTAPPNSRSIPARFIGTNVAAQLGATSSITYLPLVRPDFRETFAKNQVRSFISDVYFLIKFAALCGGDTCHGHPSRKTMRIFCQ